MLIQSPITHHFGSAAQVFERKGIKWSMLGDLVWSIYFENPLSELQRTWTLLSSYLFGIVWGSETFSVLDDANLPSPDNSIYRLIPNGT